MMQGGVHKLGQNDPIEEAGSRDDEIIEKPLLM
jgi:hypothetical protein